MSPLIVLSLRGAVCCRPDQPCTGPVPPLIKLLSLICGFITWGARYLRWSNSDVPGTGHTAWYGVCSPGTNHNIKRATGEKCSEHRISTDKFYPFTCRNITFGGVWESFKIPSILPFVAIVRTGRSEVRACY